MVEALKVPAYKSPEKQMEVVLAILKAAQGDVLYFRQMALDAVAEGKGRSEAADAGSK